jgi:hypothetical protein
MGHRSAIEIEDEQDALRERQMKADDVTDFVAAHRPKQMPARVAWAHYPADAKHRDVVRAALLARDHEWLEIVDALVNRIITDSHA